MPTRGDNAAATTGTHTLQKAEKRWQSCKGHAECHGRRWSHFTRSSTTSVGEQGGWERRVGSEDGGRAERGEGGSRPCGRAQALGAEGVEKREGAAGAGHGVAK